jgi:hypothetical protein
MKIRSKSPTRLASSALLNSINAKPSEPTIIPIPKKAISIGMPNLELTRAEKIAAITRSDNNRYIESPN